MHLADEVYRLKDTSKLNRSHPWQVDHELIVQPFPADQVIDNNQ